LVDADAGEDEVVGVDLGHLNSIPPVGVACRGRRSRWCPQLGQGLLQSPTEVVTGATRVSVWRGIEQRGKNPKLLSIVGLLYDAKMRPVTSSRQERPPATRGRWARRRAVVLRDEGMRMSSFFYFVAERVRGLALGCGFGHVGGLLLGCCVVR
jgi:hypothetical protein